MGKLKFKTGPLTKFVMLYVKLCYLDFKIKKMDEIEFEVQILFNEVPYKLIIISLFLG
jgi:hypothetical protein